MKGLFPTWAAIAVALACTSTVVIAQETTSSIRGSITSGEGTAVAGATVSIVHIPSGTTSSVVSGAGGSFSASGLRPGGPYKVTVSASGFDAKSQEGFYSAWASH
ncbi:MAG: carboxypeptidase-like regulatory domain-containing protein [Pseudomonadota bacterium]